MKGSICGYIGPFFLCFLVVWRYLFFLFFWCRCWLLCFCVGSGRFMSFLVQVLSLEDFRFLQCAKLGLLGSKTMTLNLEPYVLLFGRVAFYKKHDWV